MKAIIAGGGIGGLTAALCLIRRGLDVEVYEQAAAVERVGAGIQLSPNAMRVFRALGLEREICARGFRPEAISLRMGVSGMRLADMPLGDYAEERWGAPYVHIHRASLVEVLRAALDAARPGCLKLGRRVTGIADDGDGIRAVLDEDGACEGDVLIGADGIHSAVRESLFGPDAPVFTGNVAWRCVVPVEALGGHAPEPAATAWMGRGRHAVTYLLDGGALANFVGVVEQDNWTEESWTALGSKAEALADFEGWHPVVSKLIEKADALYRWAIFDRPPLAAWSKGRCTLLGDAAHPMPPFMAQGAAMAVEDAWSLAAHLAAADEPGEALKRYEAERLPRTARMQAASRGNAAVFHQRTALGRLKTYGPMWIAGRIAPKLGLQRQDWAYSYDVIGAAR